MTTSFDVQRAAYVIGTCSDIVRGAAQLIENVDLVDLHDLPDAVTLVSYALEHVSDDLDAIGNKLERATRS